jgi:hypothetical protein
MKITHEQFYERLPCKHCGRVIRTYGVSAVCETCRAKGLK